MTASTTSPSSAAMEAVAVAVAALPATDGAPLRRGRLIVRLLAKLL